MCWHDWQIEQLIEEFDVKFCKDCKNREQAIEMITGEILNLGPENFGYETRKKVVDTFYGICEESRKNPIMICYGRTPEK